MRKQLLLHACILAAFLASPAALAGMADSVQRLTPSFISGGGNAKAIAQLSCFLRKNLEKSYRSKTVTSTPDPVLHLRCNNKSLRIQNESAVAIVDYTQLSNRPRFYLFDLRQGKVSFLHVGHGRYGETDRGNTQFSNNPKRNSILKAMHFSNEPGRNASAGGFYLSGEEYMGSYKRSLILHGIEGGVNDNSCERTTVIHKSSYISDHSTGRMSSGCPMVAPHKIDTVIDALLDGALVYIYTPAEAALSADNCGRNLLE